MVRVLLLLLLWLRLRLLPPLTCKIKLPPSNPTRVACPPLPTTSPPCCCRPSSPPTPAPAPDHQPLAVRLTPGQQHTITLALSAADGRHRPQEQGLLQQLLLLLLAVATGSELGRQLLLTPGVATLDVPEPVPAAAAAAAPAAAALPLAGNSAEAALTAAGSGSGGGGGGREPVAAAYRVFVVARRATAALVRRPCDLSSLLNADVAPFIPGGLLVGPVHVMEVGHGSRNCRMRTVNNLTSPPPLLPPPLLLPPPPLLLLLLQSLCELYSTMSHLTCSRAIDQVGHEPPAAAAAAS